MPVVFIGFILDQFSWVLSDIVRRQLTSMALAGVVMIVAALVDYRHVERFAPLIFAGALGAFATMSSFELALPIAFALGFVYFAASVEVDEEQASAYQARLDRELRAAGRI